MIHNGTNLLVLLPAGQIPVFHDVIDLCSCQIEHIGLDLLGKIKVRAVSEELLGFLIDAQVAVPPPILICAGG